MPDAPDLARLVAEWAVDPTTTLFAPLAEALRKRGELTRAGDLATEGTRARPEFLPGWLVLAAIRRDQGDEGSAAEATEQAAAIDPSHPLVAGIKPAPGNEQARPLSPNAHAVDLVPVPVSTAQATEPLLLPAGTIGVPDVEAAIADGDDSDVGEDESAGEELMFGDEVDPSDLDPAADSMATMSLALLYQGQGHLQLALQVLDTLVARDPDDAAALSRRQRIRAELDSLRPPSYRADETGGRSVRDWLAGAAKPTPPRVAPASSFDAFYQPPAESPSPRSDDFAAFQAWLKELER